MVSLRYHYEKKDITMDNSELLENGIVDYKFHKGKCTRKIVRV